LLKAQVSALTTDDVTLERAQGILENRVLPKLNQAISRLDAVMAMDNFEFNITHEGETLQLDKGEVGPLLAGMKVLKAYLITFVAIELHLELDGSYGWLDDIAAIESYDNLSETETAALDHVTSIFKDPSMVTIRDDWKAAYSAVPDLLVSAIEDIKAGLQYGIDESEMEGTQDNDPYVVGTGVNADVDPADFQNAINALDIVKAYLSGERTMEWKTASGSDAAIRVNFRKAWQIYSPAEVLPYFEFYPYAEWDDEIPSDDPYYTKTKGPAYFTDAQGNETFSPEMDDNISSLSDLTGKVVFPDPTFGGVFPGLTNENFWSTLAQFEEGIDESVFMDCEETLVQDPYYPEYSYTERQCTPKYPGDNAGDLALFAYYIGMLGM
jgi:hypothetical protein